jgi:hypothetical protein
MTSAQRRLSFSFEVTIMRKDATGKKGSGMYGIDSWNRRVAKRRQIDTI